MTKRTAILILLAGTALLAACDEESDNPEQAAAPSAAEIAGEQNPGTPTALTAAEEPATNPAEAPPASAIIPAMFQGRWTLASSGLCPDPTVEDAPIEITASAFGGFPEPCSASMIEQVEGEEGHVTVTLMCTGAAEPRQIDMEVDGDQLLVFYPEAQGQGRGITYYRCGAFPPDTTPGPTPGEPPAAPIPEILTGPQTGTPPAEGVPADGAAAMPPAAGTEAATPGAGDGAGAPAEGTPPATDATTTIISPPATPAT